MPSIQVAAPLPSASSSETTPAGPSASPAFQLAQASRALWAATLSLTTAFMQTPAPAHRYLLARRISRNFETLADQDCFDTACRARFGKLARRWHGHSQEYAPTPVKPRSFWRLLFS